MSTIYEDMNQYHVVMEVEPEFWQSPQTLNEIYVSTSGGALSGTEWSAAAPTAFQIKGSGAGASPQTNPSPDAGTGAGTGTGATSSSAAANYRLNQLTNSTGAASTGSALTTTREPMMPLSAFSYFGPGLTPLGVNHQGPFVAATISFNLARGQTLGTALTAIERTMRELHVPMSVHGEFAGTAMIFQQTQLKEPLLILGSLLTVYIVLGILYESLTQPLTILSTLPSSGIGAIVALLLFGEQFTLISLIAVILLIGVVLKNAIMMVDVALVTQRAHEESPWGGDPRRLHAALSAHHDDDPGGHARRAAARHHDGSRNGDAPPARRCHRGRTLHQPDPDALHDARRLHLSRTLPCVGRACFVPRESGSPRPRNRSLVAPARPVSGGPGAGAGASPADAKLINEHVAQFLASGAGSSSH